MKRLACALLFLAACSSPRSDPAPRERVGVLLMAHGGDDAWNREVEQAVEPLRSKYDIEIAFGMAECHTLRTALRTLESRGATTVVVVRLFVRSESFRERIEYLLGLRKEPPGGKPPRRDCCVESPAHDVCTPVEPRARIVLSRAIDGDALLGPVLAERAAALSRTPEREAVLLLSHGLGDDAANDRLLADIDRLADHVRRARPFREVRAETLREDWPDKRAPSEERIAAFMNRAKNDGLDVIVIPYRVAGFGDYKDLLKGWEYRADGRGFLPHGNVTRWIEERVVALE